MYESNPPCNPTITTTVKTPLFEQFSTNNQELKLNKRKDFIVMSVCPTSSTVVLNMVNIKSRIESENCRSLAYTNEVSVK